MTLSWNSYDSSFRAMIDRLPGKDYDVVIGIARSGLIAAVQAAHMLKIRQFGAISIRRTLSDEQDVGKIEPRLEWQALPPDIKGKRVLLVDDIVGEGKSLVAARDLLQGLGSIVTSCSVVVNLANFKGGDINLLLDSYGILVHEWVVFPWGA